MSEAILRKLNDLLARVAKLEADEVDALDTVPDHDHTGDAGDGGQISHDTALTDVSANDHHNEDHASRHPTGGADEIDGDKLDIDWDPSNYTPATTPSEADSVDNLTAHLYGIDQALPKLALVHPTAEYTALDLDFTGTDYDTKAECQDVGVRFSDDDNPPFPDLLYAGGAIAGGTWTHSAGNGWQPGGLGLLTGPALLIPLIRSGQWELEVNFNYPGGQNANVKGDVMVGYMSNSNHVGAIGAASDASATGQKVRWVLATNDGDDTHTAQHVGVGIDPAAGSYGCKFRCQNGCVGVYDEQAGSWVWYEGTQNAGHAYTAAWAFVQIFGGANSWNIYLESLTLTYLL